MAQSKADGRNAAVKPFRQWVRVRSCSRSVGLKLNRKMRVLESAQQQSVRERVLPDGRIRYYGREKPPKNPSPTRDASTVTKYNPNTGRFRSWYESYDQSGNVNRVYPRMIDGFPVNSQHYPPTGKKLGQ